MKVETRVKFLKLSLGETILIPWKEIPATFGRPKAGATLSIGEKIFIMRPSDDGLEIARIK